MLEATVRGGYGTTDHGSLADRSARSEPQASPPNPARHCFVDGAPSLLTEWRRQGLAWEGRVISVHWVDTVGWVTAERWLPAGEIRAP